MLRSNEPAAIFRLPLNMFRQLGGVGGVVGGGVDMFRRVCVCVCQNSGPFPGSFFNRRQKNQIASHRVRGKAVMDANPKICQVPANAKSAFLSCFGFKSQEKFWRDGLLVIVVVEVEDHRANLAHSSFDRSIEMTSPHVPGRARRVSSIFCFAPWKKEKTCPAVMDCFKNTHIWSSKRKIQAG